jgi:hypothetical protein
MAYAIWSDLQRLDEYLIADEYLDTGHNFSSQLGKQAGQCNGRRVRLFCAQFPTTRYTSR